MDAFETLTNITSVSIPNSVTSIGYEAFGICPNLTNVTIPSSITNIAEYAFFQCASLQAVTIPTNVTIIRVEVFGDCTSLTSVIIPATVTAIQSGAFEGCGSLTAFYFQGNEPTLGAGAFQSVNSAAKVYYLAGATGWGATYGGLPTVLLSSPLQIGSVGIETNQFAFTITGTNGQIVVVEACTNLLNATWQPIQTNTLTGTTTNFVDPQWKSYPNRFYRLVSP
jgi:hypothetical protein